MANIITGEGYKKEDDYLIDPRTGLKFPNLSEEIETDIMELNIDTFSKYLDLLVQKSTYSNKNVEGDKNVCFMSSVFASNYFIKIDLNTYSIQIPDILINTINACKIDTNKRFFIIPIELEFPNTVESNNDKKIQIHNSLIIIDNLTKSIEYFEPYGPNTLINFNIKDAILDITHILIEDGDYLFKNVQLLCQPQDAKDYCLAKALLFINLRILNINIANSDNLTSFLTKVPPNELMIYTRRYINNLKNNTQYVNSKIFSSYQLYPIKISDNLVPAIKERIRYLLNLYYNYKIKDPRIIEELVSYRSQIYFQDEFIKFFNSFNFF